MSARIDIPQHAAEQGCFLVVGVRAEQGCFVVAVFVALAAASAMASQSFL